LLSERARDREREREWEKQFERERTRVGPDLWEKGNKLRFEALADLANLLPAYPSLSLLITAYPKLKTTFFFPSLLKILKKLYNIK
jgi:hypothetical protein